MSNLTILRDCPICGQSILWKAGKEKPDGVEYIKTKRRSVVLVHTNCIQKEVAK